MRGKYVNSVGKGHEYILFLRKNNDIQTPYFTININLQNKVRQIHGLNNCNLPKELEPFIKEWANKFSLNISSYNRNLGHL